MPKRTLDYSSPQSYNERRLIVALVLMVVAVVAINTGISHFWWRATPTALRDAQQKLAAFERYRVESEKLAKLLRSGDSSAALRLAQVVADARKAGWLPQQWPTDAELELFKIYRAREAAGSAEPNEAEFIEYMKNAYPRGALDNSKGSTTRRGRE
jgi:hypothetical protein